MTDYAAVISALYPTARCGISDNDYSTLRWDESNTDKKPTKKALDEAWPDVERALAWKAIRAERDRRLAASDWTQVSDAPVDSAAWATYRQQLRDLPQNYILPDDVEWPEEPA